MARKRFVYFLRQNGSGNTGMTITVKRNNLRTWIALATCAAIFAVLGLLSQWVPGVDAQFIDRIVRPCGGTSIGTVRVTTTNILINPCPGGTVTINGVPITPGAGLPDPGSNGFVVRTALNTDVARTLTVSSPIVITNGSGVAGNPLFSCPTCVTSAAALTSTALMTGAGLQAAQTPAATATLLANGNISTPGQVATGNAGGVNGALDLSGLTSGTVTQTVANAAGTWTLTWPTTAGSAGQFLQTNGAGVTTWAAAGGGATCAGCTTNVLAKTTGVGTLGDSRVTDNGTDITLNSGTGIIDLVSVANEIKATNATKLITIDAFTSNGTFDGLNHLISLTENSSGNSLVIDGGIPAITLTSSTINLTSTAVHLSGELTVPKTIRTGTASNTDVAGSLTVGGGGTVTYTFTQTYATAPICVSNDTNAVPLITGASASTTVLTITGNAGHVVTYQCVGLN
jgi:hypothetical protein